MKWQPCTQLLLIKIPPPVAPSRKGKSGENLPTPNHEGPTRNTAEQQSITRLQFLFQMSYRHVLLLVFSVRSLWLLCHINHIRGLLPRNSLDGVEDSDFESVVSFNSEVNSSVKVDLSISTVIYDDWLSQCVLTTVVQLVSRISWWNSIPRLCLLSSHSVLFEDV